MTASSSLSALLLVLAAIPGQADDRLAGNALIPSSSIERSEDIGIRMHTNHRILLVPASGLGPGGGTTPTQIRSFYGMPATGGHGVIAVVDAYDYPTALNDFNVFASEFALPSETSTTVTASTNQVFQIVYADGQRPSGDASWNQEAALDIEWAHAMAPGAKIVLVEAAGSDLGSLFQAVAVAAALPGVAEVSMSWGGPEFSGETDFDSFFNVAGPVFFSAAGDTGAVVTYPSCSQYVVAAGGTSVTTTAAGTWSSEKAWSDGGGGNSAYVSKPAWQVGVAMTGSNRGVPDISSDADPGSGVPVYDSTKYENYVGWNVFGGTSVSTPCLAGMTNLSGGAFTGTTAFLQVLYSKYATTPYPFRDITTGTASSKNASNPALVGWDYATGVGTPIATTSLSPVTISVPPSPVGLLSGTSAAFTATVSGAASAAVEWSASGGTITPGSPSSSASFSAAATGVYTLTATAAAYPSATATITVDVHQDDFLDPAVSGLDVLDLVGHFGASDPALALAGDQVVSLLDLDLMLQKLGW